MTAPKRVYQEKDDTHLVCAHIPAWLYAQMKRRIAERIAEGEQITEEKYIIAALDSYSSTFFGR